MRTVLCSALALVVGLMISAVAQNAPKNQPTGCGPDTMSSKTSQGMSQSGFTDMQPLPKAVVIHAVDPDGNPVVMVIAPAQ